MKVRIFPLQLFIPLEDMEDFVNSIFGNYEQSDEDNKDFDQSDNTRLFTNKKELDEMIQDKQTPTSISHLKWLATIFFIVLWITAFYEYIYTDMKIEESITNMRAIEASNQKKADFLQILERILVLAYINEGLLPNSTPEYENKIRQEIFEPLYRIQDIQKELKLSTMKRSEEHEEMWQENVIPMYFYEGGRGVMKMFTMGEATSILVTQIINLEKEPLIHINFQEPEFIFVIHNLFNQYVVALNKENYLYADEVLLIVNEAPLIFKEILIAAAVLIFIPALLQYPLMSRVANERRKILSLFINIPEETVKDLYAKCQNFVSTI